MVVLAAGAFVPAAAQTKDTIRIAMVNFSLCCPYFIGMSQAVEEEAAFYPNIELIITDANGDAAKLTSDVEDVLAQNPDGIIISGAWLEAAPAALDAIQAAGVPVVLVDRLLKGGDYTSWIGPDNYTIGVQDGAYIVERLGGEGRLCVLRGGPADNSIGLDRSNGMLSEVEKSNIEVVEAPDYGGWSSDGGATLMEDLLAKYDKIDAVNDSGDPQYTLYKNGSTGGFNATYNEWSDTCSWKGSEFDYRQTDGWSKPSHGNNPCLGVVSSNNIYIDTMYRNAEIHAFLFSSNGVVTPTGSYGTQDYNLYCLGGLITTGTNPLSGTFKYRQYVYDKNVMSNPPPYFPTAPTPSFKNWHVVGSDAVDIASSEYKLTLSNVEDLFF